MLDVGPGSHVLGFFQTRKPEAADAEDCDGTDGVDGVDEA